MWIGRQHRTKNRIVAGVVTEEAANLASILFIYLIYSMDDVELL